MKIGKNEFKGIAVVLRTTACKIVGSPWRPHHFATSKRKIFLKIVCSLFFCSKKIFSTRAPMATLPRIFRLTSVSVFCKHFRMAEKTSRKFARFVNFSAISSKICSRGSFFRPLSFWLWAVEGIVCGAVVLCSSDCKGCDFSRS